MTRDELRAAAARVTFRAFLHDLDARFLIRIGDIEDFPEYATKVEFILTEQSDKRRLGVTKLGRAFLSFVRQSEELEELGRTGVRS